MVNRLSTDKRAQIIGALVEGNSIRATVRMTGAAKNTINKLLIEIGDAAYAYLDGAMNDLPCRHLELDEIWAFVGMKAKNVPDERRGEYGVGDVYTFTALCADCKLVPSFLVGQRNGECTELFARDLATRLRHRVQITTDGFKPYITAVPRGIPAARRRSRRVAQDVRL